ncbi:toxin-antitoxin system YwqK family antitoxin [Aquimarina rubra]|uniref:Toxin-antitoxin system YwqK family antitoxin n=1 Tax=Aquimarina rubra TaxID=1920033 RepID=A0ABW5LEF8_9FLAO
MKLLFTLILLFGSTQYINKDINRKVISDDDYNYTFYVSSKNTSNYENLKEYYWYKSGKIHSSFGGGDGQILHGQYNKTYRKNGIAEQGEFHYGLKDDTWKNWYENGKIKKISNWQKGFLSGSYQEFTESGVLLVSGKYKNNKKHGRWITHHTNDTLYFKRGEKVIKEEIAEEEKNDKNEKKSFVGKTKDFFKNIFKKKTPEEKEKEKKEKELRKQKKEIEKKRKELAKKKEAGKKNTSKKQ